MCESRTVPSGKVYRQLFDAQVQLSRSLMAGRRDTRTDCLSAEDSNTHCSTTSRLLCPPSSRRQLQVNDDVDDVSRLPDSVVVNRQRSDIIQRLAEKKHQKHKEALKQLEMELTHLAQVCESQVRTVSLELLSSLQDGDLKLNILKNRMQQLEHLEHVNVQEVCVLWEEVQQEVQLKEIKIQDLNHKLTECECQRTDEIRSVLRKNLLLLENISFLSPPDVYRLIHTEATLLNQCLLVNRRSVARLLLLLQKDNLQQESVLRLYWEDQLGRWRRTRVSQVIDCFRSLCSGEEEQQPVQETTGDLTQRRDDIISKIGSLVPPSCSTALVTDWFNQLTAINQQIDGHHGDLLHQLCCGYEQMWQNRLAEVERCEEELSALQLSEEEVNDIISSQLLPLIGRSQSEDEERLAAVDLSCDSAARRALTLSRCVFVVMRGAALLWETHRRRLERREEEVQQHLDELRRSQQQLIQRKKERLDELLVGLRQESSEEALKASLDKTVLYLQDVTLSCRQCVSGQWEVLDLLPSLLLEELLSYSSSLCSFYHLSPAYTPSPQELQNLLPSSTQPGQNLFPSSTQPGQNLLPSSTQPGQNLLPSSTQPGQNLLPSSTQPGQNLLPSSTQPGQNLLPSSTQPGQNLLPSSTQPGQNLLPSSTQPGQNLLPSSTQPGQNLQKPQEVTEDPPISCQDDIGPAQPSQDWLVEAESSLLELCDISSDVTLTSSRGVVYRGLAFRCPAPDLQQEAHLILFPVELLTHSLSRMRTLFLDHLEQRYHDVLSSAVAMVTDRKEAVRLEQELQLQQLNPEHIRTHQYQPRLAELQLHRRQVEVHCEEASDVLTSCREELQELQTSISRRNQEFTASLSKMEDDVLTAGSSRRLQAVSSTLQDCLDQHIKDTQCCQTTFRKTVHTRLEEVRTRTTQLLNSFRLFSEGGDFAPQEVKLFQRRLKEETRRIKVTEESISSELQLFESRSLQQVKEASGRLEEKLSLLKSELEFNEEIQKIISSTQVHLKAEAAISNQQQSSISSRLEDLRRMMENTQVSPDQVFCLLSSVNEDLRKRCQYLDLSSDPTLQESLSAHPKSKKPVQSAPPLGLLQTSRTGVDLLDDPVVGIIKSLNRFCIIHDVGSEASERDERGRTAAGQTLVQHLQQKCSESVNALSVRRGCRSIRTERRFQVFGPEPEQKPHSFSSNLTSVFWRANDVLLLVAEVFYQSEHCGLSRYFLVPDSLDKWAESMQQRLLGYQEETRKHLSMSREELVRQLSVLEELLHSLPSVLIRNHEQQQEAELIDEVGGVRLKLEETLTASEEEKHVNVRQLRTSLRDEELQTLTSREELRQQQLQDTVCSTHLELQVCLRDRGEEFVTSLASLTEQLLHQLDELLTPEETDYTVTMETGAEKGQKQSTVSRTWSGIPYLSPSTISTPEPSSVTMATTASITTTRCTLGHLAVQQRDAAVKRFEQLLQSESSRSDDDRRRRLSEIHRWNKHWRQQIHTLTHTHTNTH